MMVLTFNETLIFLFDRRNPLQPIGKKITRGRIVPLFKLLEPIHTTWEPNPTVNSVSTPGKSGVRQGVTSTSSRRYQVAYQVVAASAAPHMLEYNIR